MIDLCNINFVWYLKYYQCRANGNNVALGEVSTFCVGIFNRAFQDMFFLKKMSKMIFLICLTSVMCAKPKEKMAFPA